MSVCRALRRTLCLLPFVPILFGCGAGGRAARADLKATTREDAVRIAVREAADKHGWPDPKIGNVEFDNAANCWRVLLVRTPAVSGGHAMVEISAKDGKVLEWMRGM